MKIAVCDDEKHFIAKFKDIMDKLYNSLDIITDEFSQGDELLRRFRSSPYDIIFLDIEMPGMDGITLARKLRALSDEVCIVFLTGHVEYAIQGYEVNALRYLTKPADESKVREVVDYVLSKQANAKQLWLKTSDGDVKLRLSDVLFIESQNQNIAVNTAKDTYVVRGNISDYEERLAPEGFFRIHRGYLISLDKVIRITGKEVIMENGTPRPVSRTRESKLRDVMFSFVSREAF